MQARFKAGIETEEGYFELEVELSILLAALIHALEPAGKKRFVSYLRAAGMIKKI